MVFQTLKSGIMEKKRKRKEISLRYERVKDNVL